MAFSQTDLYTSHYDEFEHTHQNSYSHGLEKIYALEHVDIRSVRKIESPPVLNTKIPLRKSSAQQVDLVDDQLALPFGFPFEKKLEPFIYREPIQVLGFTKRVESWLLTLGKYTLGDLLDSSKQSLIPLTGIGQGHQDEIRQKVLHYLQQNLPKALEVKINFDSWAKALFGDLEPKKCAVLFDAFELPLLTPLSPAESAEVRKLSPENRKIWLEEALESCQTPSKAEQIECDILQLVEVYIKPWLSLRHGIAHIDEIEEYLLKLSGFYAHTPQMLAFFSETYFDGLFPLGRYLHQVEKELYCDSTPTALAFETVISKAQSYFYKDLLYYPLDSLNGLLERELAKNWTGYPDLFIERALRVSSRFRVRKGPSEQLVVKLS